MVRAAGSPSSSEKMGSRAAMGRPSASISATVAPSRGQRCAPVTTSCKVSARLAASFWITGRSRPYSARVAVTTVTMGGMGGLLLGKS